MSHEPDVLCLSHLRWNFVYQRPQHLLSRCARHRRVFFLEEPIFDTRRTFELDSQLNDDGVVVCVPHMPEGTPTAEAELRMRPLLDHLVERERIVRPVLWYYTPMALAFSHELRARAVVYDCMDELSLFKGAPPELTDRERFLLASADVVFTGGHSLYEHKRALHPNIHPFPSSVDVPHFARARTLDAEPADQAGIPHPRIGFFGVVDERMDVALIDALAAARPDLHLVMLGPTAKIDPADLPRRPNLHWLGGKSYGELPDYLAGWDVAILPFARNDSTRFISPTKTPEYLAAGCPVVSTSIRDVVRPYGELGLARIADDAAGFAAAIDEALAQDRDQHLARSDAYLQHLSWDRTWSEMWALVDGAIHGRARRQRPSVASAGAGAGAGSITQPALARLDRED